MLYTLNIYIIYDLKTHISNKKYQKHKDNFFVTFFGQLFGINNKKVFSL